MNHCQNAHIWVFRGVGIMGNIIFTSTGCVRCKMVKRFMHENNITYVEKDIKEGGKEDFNKFYKQNRKDIFRGATGVEFPVFTDIEVIRQGVSACIGYLHSGKQLDGFVGVGILHENWVDGFYVSGGNPEYAEEFLKVLRYIKNKLNMKTQIETNGKNSVILNQILVENIADRAIMKVIGPKEIYNKALGKQIDMNDVIKSMAMIPKFYEYRFETTIAPVVRKNNEVTYITTEEIAETAKLIEEATGNKKNIYMLRAFDPKKATENLSKFMDVMTPSMLFPYRSAARTHQVFSDIDKN